MIVDFSDFALSATSWKRRRAGSPSSAAANYCGASSGMKSVLRRVLSGRALLFQIRDLNLGPRGSLHRRDRNMSDLLPTDD